MRPINLENTLVKMIHAKLPVLIKGKPGIGKTDIVTTATKKAGAELIVTHPVVSDPVDFKGMPFVKGGEADFLPLGELREILSAKKPTVFFMDDLGQAAPAVQAAAMQLILARRINGHKVSDHVVFVAATNRKQDRAGVSGILEPVKSRFVSILELDVSVDDWSMWASAHDMPPELVGFINFRKELLDKFEPTGDITNSPCPRTVAHVGKLMKLGLEPLSLLQEAISGAAGVGFASEFIGFLEVARTLPDPAKVLKRPSLLSPSEVRGWSPAMKWAFVTAIATIVVQDTMQAFVNVLERFETEFGVLGMRMTTSRDVKLMKTSAFVSWAVKNQEVMMPT